MFLIVDEFVKEVEIPISQKFKSVLAEMRMEYAITFSNIREAINTTPPPLDKLMPVILNKVVVITLKWYKMFEIHISQSNIDNLTLLIDWIF